MQNSIKNQQLFIGISSQDWLTSKKTSTPPIKAKNMVVCWGGDQLNQWINGFSSLMPWHSTKDLSMATLFMDARAFDDFLQNTIFGLLDESLREFGLNTELYRWSLDDGCIGLSVDVILRTNDGNQFQRDVASATANVNAVSDAAVKVISEIIGVPPTMIVETSVAMGGSKFESDEAEIYFKELAPQISAKAESNSLSCGIEFTQKSERPVI